MASALSSCLLYSVFCLLFSVVIACNPDARQRGGIPPGAQATIDAVSEDMGDGRYEKIYDEASEEWRRTATLEQSNEIFTRLQTRLGRVRGRTYQTAREEQSSGGEVPGHSLTVRYSTTFERGEGMETFTLVERDGRWLLARYFVNSDALK
jgi:hypothetical protein